MQYKSANMSGINVSYHSELNGGGTLFGRDMAHAVSRTVGTAGSVLEICAGPGFIGFDLLGAGLCQRLTLADINPAAVKAAERTISDNQLADRVQVRESDVLSGIAEGEIFDLVVGNPPHSGTAEQQSGRGPEIVYQDIGWEIHKRFYSTVRKHLSTGGSVLLQENSNDSSLADFAPMIEKGGLEVVDTFPCAQPGWEEEIYYVWARLR
jgi:methylase of polypeptide subunit release factors